MAKNTALLEEHQKLGGKIVDFAGWNLPVQYQGLRQEHLGCRNHIGLFDVSHMGELRVRGKNTIPFLNNLLTNNVSKIVDGQAQYTVMCYENGGCVDDLIIHRISADDFFICVNASNSDKDFDWFLKNKPDDVSVENESSQWTQIAVQGRDAEKLVQKMTKKNLSEISYYHFAQDEILGIPSIIARTGYTGEDGFELYLPWDKGPEAWQFLIKEGEQYQITPCGLGARDTLRTEMKFPLYGHEIDKDLNPLEAGLGWVVKMDKANFIGKPALEKLKADGLKRKTVGLVSIGKGIPRQGYPLEKDGKNIGVVCSGTMSPSLNQGIAVAYIDREFGEIGAQVDVMVRGRKVEHKIVKTPFYKRPY